MDMKTLEKNEIQNVTNIITRQKKVKKSKQFSFDIHDKDDNYETTPHIESFPEFTIDQIVGKNKLVTKMKSIEILFSYPLTNEIWLPFNNENGFTLWDIFKCVYEGYTTIYAEEDDPGYIEGMYNRSFSKGKYGIWGHYLGDLVLEGFSEITPGKFTLIVGS